MSPSETHENVMSTNGTVQYVIVNTKTELVESGPYPAEEARDRLAETREKLREQIDDVPIYVPTDLKLRRYVEPGMERGEGQ